MNIEKNNKSSLNISENIVAIIPYLGIILAYFEVTRWFCWVIPLIIFFVEKKSVLVKKHSVIAFLIYVIQLILFGIIYLLFSSNEVCAWGSCQEIPRYLTTNGNNMIITISVLISIFNIFSIYKAYKGETLDIPGLNEVLNQLTGNLNTLKGSAVEEKSLEK